MAVRIRVNGKEYESTSALPEGIRQAVGSALAEALADKDGDGVPDVVARGGDGAVPLRRYIYQGKVYDDPSQLPPEVRAAEAKAQDDGIRRIEPEGISSRILVLAVAIGVLAAGAVYYLAAR